jgi:hypothetical protein
MTNALVVNNNNARFYSPSLNGGAVMQGYNRFFIHGLGTLGGLILANAVGATLGLPSSNGSGTLGAGFLIGVGVIAALVGWYFQRKLKTVAVPNNERRLIVYGLAIEVLISFGVILVILMLFWIVLQVLFSAIK